MEGIAGDIHRDILGQGLGNEGAQDILQFVFSDVGHRDVVALVACHQGVAADPVQHS